MRVLLADGSVVIQKVVELCLRSQRFGGQEPEVVTVQNGRLAIAKVQELRPDVVLCDISLPEKDGYEVCEFIKASTNLSHIPVLLLVATFKPFDQDRAERAHYDGYLRKPFEPEALVGKIAEVLAVKADEALQRVSSLQALRKELVTKLEKGELSAPSLRPSGTLVARDTPTGAPTSDRAGLVGCGCLLCLAGMAGCVATLAMQTTIAIPRIGEIQSPLLLKEQHDAQVFWGAVALIGIVLVWVGRSRR